MTEKMFVTKTPALPSTCAVCNNHAKGNKDFVDFGTDLDYYGAILICADCAVNMAKLVGFVPVANVEREKIKFDELAKYLVVEKEKVKALEHIIAAYGFDRHLDSVVGGVDDLTLPFEPESTNNPDSDSVSGEVAESGLNQPATV